MSDFVLSFGLEHWQTWVIPLAGLMSACAALFVGHAWLRGRQKVAPPAPKECEAAPDPFLNGGVHEKRQAFRRGGRLTKILVADAVASNPPTVGFVLDRSVNGVGLLLDKAVPEHTILSIRTVDAPEKSPWVQVQVRRCEAQESQWEVGCVFVRTPPWAVLLLFG